MFPGNDFPNYKYLSNLIIRKFPEFHAYISFGFLQGSIPKEPLCVRLKPKTRESDADKGSAR